jgi:hypothetical protein
LKTSILTTAEFEWLTNKKKISKGYERKIKCHIQKKIKIFQEMDLPLLIERGFLTNQSVTAFSNSSVTVYGNNGNLPTNTEHKIVLRPGFEPGIVALRGRNA